MSGTALAQERRSQPQQIADLQRQYSELRQLFALDSQTLHTQLLEHDAALVHFREVLDEQALQIEAQERRIAALEAARRRDSERGLRARERVAELRRRLIGQ